MRYLPIVILLLSMVFIAPLSHAAYIITAINTTVSTNLNTSARVIEIYKVSISNTSVGQYTTDRLALNFTLSQWQNVIGSGLTEHIINPRGGSIYDFNFIPGPIVSSNNGKIADLVLSYIATNVTTINQTGPRAFLYKFNRGALNYQNAESGEVLGLNTSLTVILPIGSRIDLVSPNPDYPAFGFAKSYRNVTSLTWDSDEALSQFTLMYTINESLQDEVLSFFQQIYNYLGGFAILIIIIGVAALVIYTYLKSGK